MKNKIPVKIIKDKPLTQRFLMKQNYDFVPVLRQEFENPEETGYINNQAEIHRYLDGSMFYDLRCENIDGGDFKNLCNALGFDLVPIHVDEE